VLLNENANILERVSYDAYGRPRHHRKGDFTGDGATDVADLLVVNGNWGNSGAGDDRQESPGPALGLTKTDR